MKRVVVTLPEGMTVSPSAAQGLGYCSPAQIGLGPTDPVSCPDATRYGQLTLHTPIFPPTSPRRRHLHRQQNHNPFGTFLAFYLVIQEHARGLLIKISGRIDLDPETGQIVTTFDDLPQYPFTDIQLTFKGGLRAALVNPTTCGTKTITTTFYSWADPTTPTPVTSSYDVTQKADGSPCVDASASAPSTPSSGRHRAHAAGA